MDMRFNLNLLFEEEPSKQEYIITKEKIKISEEGKPNMVHEEAKQENEIIFYLKEKKVEQKSTLEVVLLIIPQSHSYPLHCPNFGIEANIIKQAHFLFVMSKFRNEVLYGIFPFSASHVLLIGSWMFDCCVSYSGHDSYKHQGQSPALSSLPNLTTTN